MTEEQKLAKVKDTCFGKYRDKKDVLELFDTAMDRYPEFEKRFIEDLKGKKWTSGDKLREFHLAVHGGLQPYENPVSIIRYQEEGGVHQGVIQRDAVEMTEEEFVCSYYLPNLDQASQREGLLQFQKSMKEGRNYFCSYPVSFMFSAK